MNTPHPRPLPAAPLPRDAAQIGRWLTLRHELAELHARLEYLKLMTTLRVWR